MEETSMKHMSIKTFGNNLLSGVAIAIVAGLIPNAILGEIFKALAPKYPFFLNLLHIVQSIQFTIPALIGTAIAIKFKLNPLATVVVASATFVGSGVAQLKGQVWVLAGVGDLINAITVCTLYYDKYRSDNQSFYRITADSHVNLNRTVIQFHHHFTIIDSCDFTGYRD